MIPTRSAADVDDGPRAAGLEVALLVEDAVVGEVDLAVDRMDCAVGEDGGRVEDVLGPLGEADDRDDVACLSGKLLEGLAGVREEVLLEQQVLGRVSGQRQLGEHDQLRAGLAGLTQACGDLLGVARDVADGGVQLAEGEAHGAIVSAARSGARARVVSLWEAAVLSRRWRAFARWSASPATFRHSRVLPFWRRRACWRG